MKNFKYIGCGSAPLPLEVQKAMEEKFLLRVANLYGLSETGPTHVDNPLEDDWTPGSLGYPLDVNTVKIFKDDGTGASKGEVGEIGIKGPNVFVAYYNNVKQYQRVFREGYFLTGDLGFEAEDGDEEGASSNLKMKKIQNLKLTKSKKKDLKRVVGKLQQKLNNYYLE